MHVFFPLERAHLPLLTREQTPRGIQEKNGIAAAREGCNTSEYMSGPTKQI